MRLRKECEHGRWESHVGLKPLDLASGVECPDCEGRGCFGFSELQPQAGEICRRCGGAGILDALASQVGESE